MDEWNWDCNADGELEFLHYQEQWCVEEEGPFSPEDSGEVEWTPFEDSDITF